MNVYPGFRRLAPVDIALVHSAGPRGAVLCLDPSAAAVAVAPRLITCPLCRKIILRTAEGRAALRPLRARGAGRAPNPGGYR